MFTIDTSRHYDYLRARALFTLNNNSLLSHVGAIKSYARRGDGNNTFARPSRINCHVEIGRAATGSPRVVCCHVGVA